MFESKTGVFRGVFGGVLACSVGIGAILIGWSSRSSLVTSAGAAECYRMERDDQPMSMIHLSRHTEIWCYRSVDKPKGARLIYQIDENGVTKPELSMLVEADGTIAHASILKGELSVHRVRGFNPLNAPLSPPPGAKPVPVPISLASDSSVANTIGVFQEVEFIELEPVKVREGEFASSVSESGLPWRGYWFPYSSARLYAGWESPMAKYDRFIERRAVVNPGAQGWEAGRHYYSGVNWEGHCNGWAAASILRPEPKRSITDPYSGVTFSVSDLKGLWSERDYCPRIAFFGRRNWGRAGNDPRDIYPQEFHKVVVHYLGQLKKPILMDLMPDPAIENRVVSGYEMTVRQVASYTYLVDTILTIHEYDKQPINEPGVAPPVQRLYRYYLMTDEEGTVINGSWLSNNPDFIWVPLSPGDCTDKNQAVDEFWIKEILKFDVPPTPTPRPSPRPSPIPAP